MLRTQAFKPTGDIYSGDLNAFMRDQAKRVVDTVADFRLMDMEDQKVVFCPEIGASYLLNIASAAADDGDTVIIDASGRRYEKLAGGGGAGGGATAPICISVAAIKALATAVTKVAFLRLGARSGWFEFRAGNYSAAVTADTLEGFYIKATDTASSAGCWVRVDDTPSDPRWWGAVGIAIGTTPTVNDTAAYKAWCKHGGVMQVPPGLQFMIDDEGVLDKPHVILPSTGRFWVKATFPAGKVVLRSQPSSTSLGNFGCGIDGLRYHYENQADMSTEGDTLALDATVFRSFHGYYVRNCVFSVGPKGASLRLINPSAFDQVLYAAFIQNNSFGANVSLYNCGDSVHVTGNAVQNQGHNKPSVEISNIPGAAQCQVTGNNLTGGAGMVYAENCEQLNVADNQIEKQATAWLGTAPTKRGCVVLQDCKRSTVELNNITAGSGAVNGCHAIMEINTQAGVAVLNALTSRRNRYVNNPVIAADGSVGFYHLVYQGNLATFENNNCYQPGSTSESAPAVFRRSGVDTLPIHGIWEKLYQDGAWVDGDLPGYVAGVFGKAMEDGTIHLRGHIKDGSVTAGDLIAALPQELFLNTPSTMKTMRSVPVWNGSAFVTGLVDVGNGSVPHGIYAKSVPAANGLVFDGVVIATGAASIIA